MLRIRPCSIVFLLALPVLAACQRQGVDSAPTSAASTEPSAISLDPATAETCHDAVVTVKWDGAFGHPGVTGVEIWVGYGSNTKLWHRTGVKGSAQTGAWTHPGAVFILKNQAGGAELARAVMQGPKCG
ncbi:MAG: hypothetical protein ABJA62_03760 [Luteimonas sp.]